MTLQTNRLKQVAIETHGCKLNQSDSMELASQFAAGGFDVVDGSQSVDVYVLNTCTVTHVADRKARQALRSARRRSPDATIVVTGCYAERAPETLRGFDDVDLVVGNQDKSILIEQLARSIDIMNVPCGNGSDSEPIILKLGRTRGMVKIQEGCDQVCSYCIVPKVRGRERSLPVDSIVSRIADYEAQGLKEIVLTGTQLGSYGFDMDRKDLKSLLREILERTCIPRIRVSSLQPQDIDDGLLELWNNPRLCPHFHMPLQSGSDAVLKRMRRRYTALMYEATIDKIQRKVGDVAITADVIVGFPGETRTDFEQTVRLCERIRFADLHVFPYSSRPGTSAAHFQDSVTAEDKAARCRMLIDMGQSHAKAFKMSLVGTTRSVLWEKRRVSADMWEWSGLTDNYVRVVTVSEAKLRNAVTPAYLTSAEDGLLRAHVGSLVVEEEPHK
ncbi:tRNA (N(6)-L-threonylcarbamoyladenosine(37)-C(2))-methylthiotransferase MtaB [Dehalococcoidia bacterium]|nr:tRNA (N(6)-L-threonylcarbamoyladenosine(37)-C(2))-methylthiotransferase MtaB [Dehalococcoidia bacterium]